MADKVTQLYNALKSDGLFKQARSLNDFKAKMAYSGYRSQIYKLARDKGADVGTFSQFTGALGYKSGSPRPQNRGKGAAQAVKPTWTQGNEQTQQVDSSAPMTAAQRALQMLYQPSGGDAGQQQQTQQNQVDYLSRPQNQMPKYGKAPKGNVSSFVQSLYSQDDAERSGIGQAPYTMPRGKKEDSAFVQNQKRRLERQQQFNRGAATPEGMLNNYTKQRNKPMVDTGSPEANQSIVKTQGQLMDEMNASADKLVAGSNDYINGLLDKSLGEANAAAEKTMQRYLGGGSNRDETPWYERLYGGSGQSAMAMRAYNTQISPEAVQKRVMSAMDNTIEGLLSDPKFLQDGMNEAERIGVSPQDYIEGFLKPRLASKLEEGLRAKQLDKFLPRNALQMALNKYINSNTVMKIATLGTSARSQRQLNEEAMAMTDEGKNPHYKPGVGGTIAGVAGEVAGMVSDPIFKGSAALGGKFVGAILGNGTSIASKIANGSVMQKLGYMAGSSAVGGGVTGFTFGFAGGLVNNLSTGEDTSLGNTLKMALSNAAGEAGSFAVMGVAGAPLGVIGQGVGSKTMQEAFSKEWWKAAVPKVGLSAAKTYTEAFGMNLGGYVSQKIQGNDAEFDFWNGNLESLPTAIGFRLTHLRGGQKHKDEKGNNLKWYQNVLFNLSQFAMSDKAKSANMVFTEDEKQQLFGSGSIHGLMPNGENIVDFARRANKNVKGESPSNYADVESDTEVLSTYYDRIINDPNVSWDAKAKFTTMVMGVIPGARPMHDYYGFSIEDINGKTGKYISSFSKDGTLLSKRRYDNPEQRGSIIYEIAARNENAKLKNAYAIAVGSATDMHDIQAQFLMSQGYRLAPDYTQRQMLADLANKSSVLYRNFLLWCTKQADTPVGRAVAKVSEITGMSAEGIMKAFNKDPMKRSDAEQNVSVIFRKALTNEVFPESKPHPEQAGEDGKDVVAENGLGTEQPNGEAVVTELRNLHQAEEEMTQLMKDNDVFSENFNSLQQQGMTHPQIYDWMIQSGLTEEQLAPYAHYMNQVAKVQGMQNATAKAIEENVGAFVQDWSYHGTLNGVSSINFGGGSDKVLYVDYNGKEYLVGSGDVSFGEPDQYMRRRGKENIGDMLVCLDTETGEMAYLPAKDVYYSRESTPEELKEARKQQLQQINSVPYNQAAQEQAAAEAAKPKTEEKPVENGTQQGTATDMQQTEQSQQEDGFGQDSLDDQMLDDVKPVGKGSFGDVYDQFKGNANGAIKLLLRKKSGEAIGALHHKDVGDIDLVWGKEGTGHSNGFGLAKLAKYHPEVLDNLQEILDGMHVVSRSKNRINLESDTHKAGIRLEWDGKKKNWLLTAFKKENASADGKRTDTSSTSLGGDTALSQTEGSPFTGKDTNNSSNGNGINTTLTFKDGSPVPVDANGEPDFMNMTPEQGVEVYKQLFPKTYEAEVDNAVKILEADLKKVQKATPKSKGTMARANEQRQIDEAISLAEAQLERAREIKKAMTAEKVAATMGKNEGEKEVAQITEGMAEATKNFAEAPKVEGRKGTITLPNGEEISGTYYAVPAMSLIPSHDPFNDYKPHEGAPLDENGHTINDRDYYNDKGAQDTTNKAAMDYDGRAISDVPVVNPDGRVISGNGRTMAGQLAAANGKDGKYTTAMEKNAEGFGMKAEDLGKLDHARIIFVPDEALPYTTDTFAKFNRNEKKTQSNTEQAVAKSKTLSADEVGAIVADIEGNGSLDAFFNNPKAINDLVKTLVSKGVIGQNEVAELMEGADRLSPQGKEMVKNILLGSIFKPETIRMLGIDSAIKNKAIAGIRAVMDNLKLGDYALRDEIDSAIQLLYEARQGGNKVDTLLRTPEMFKENAADRYPSISQMMALALEGKVSDFRDLLNEYNKQAAARNTGEADVFGDVPTKDELIRDFLNYKKWVDYDTRGNSEREGGNDAEGVRETEPEAQGGNGAERQANKLAEVETDSENKIDDYIAEHYPHHNGVRARTKEEQAAYDAETEAMKNDETLKQMRKDADEAFDNAASSDLADRIKETDEESEVEGEHGTTYRKTYLLDDKKVVKVDEPNDKGEYTGSYYEYDGKKFGDLKEVADYIDGNAAPKEKDTTKNGKKIPQSGKKHTTSEKKHTTDTTNPVKSMEDAAASYKDEQVDKAKKAYEDAKASGNEEETAKAAKTLKHLMDEKLKEKGYTLRQRQIAIALQVGKKEAETIDKPFDEMDLEEREFTASKNPLTESEINELTSEENKDLIPAALDYLHGNTDNMVGLISYLKIWNDVRSRHENAADNSGAENGAQLAPADNGSGEGMGLGSGRDSGRPDGPVDRGTGEESAPGERGSGESGENNPTLPFGEPSDKQGKGTESRVGDVSARGAESEGSSGAGKDGNVSKRGGRKGSRGPAAKNAERKPTAKQGTHFPNGTAEQLKKEREEYEKKKKDFWARFNKAGQGYLKIALTPFKRLNLSPKQIEMLPELFKLHLQGGFLKIKEGIFKFNEWKKAMLAEEGEELKMIGLSDDDIDRFIDDYWNTPYEMDGEKHTLGQWSSIYGSQKLREKLATPLAEKYKRQMDAEPIKVKVGDRKNIEETLPYLLPQQQEDVYRAETQFFGKEHADREHAYGKGYMFTNGTGTGKTYTGLGFAKRMVKQGKKRILFVTPSQKKVSDWIKDGKNLGLDIRSLDDWAKERGTSATTENGEGCVITTFANFGTNKKLLEAEWDAVIYDESHRIMENKDGKETARSMQHYKVTNRDENHCFLRLQDINPHYQKMQSAADKFTKQRAKEMKRITDEYKKTHPSANDKDVINATHKLMPNDINSFAPADAQTFPKLGKLYNDFKEAQVYYYENVKPELEKQAKETWKNTKTVFLSATPFNTRENLDYAEGYIFKYPKDDGGKISPRSRFYLDHFGAAYKFRYNRLENHVSNPDAVAKQEVAFSDYLQHTLGTMSGRIIDSPYDYSRDFPTVAPDHADDFNNAVQECLHTRHLYSAYLKTIGDYNYGSALFETMKVANIIDRVKEHIAAGRKVVIYHRRVETKEPIRPPFEYMLDVANQMIKQMQPGKERDEFIAEANAFREKHQDLLQWEQTLDYSMPREQIAKVFGKDNVLFFSGKESKKVKDAAVDTFNDDNGGKNILVIQEASGKEGISLHDTTGKHQRVVITLALPQSPITALQIEGRIYRIGNMSNAIFEYPILGLNSEMMLFGQKFNNQVSTTENLALGSQARNLRDSFAKGILEHSGIVPIDQQGVGGKAFDAPKQEGSSDPFDDAVLDYYSNQKLNKNNREGVDYFPTPEPLGYKMVQWAGLQEGDSVLEPSAGHGAIARYVPQSNELVSIEPSQNLFARLQLKVGSLGRKFLNNIFENYDIHNKHDAVVMNPPFGKAGSLAIPHLDKAFKHLDEGGRIVAILPMGSAYNKYNKWLSEQKDAVERTEILLPDITFQQAGTNVRAFVAIIDKVTNANMRDKAGISELIDLAKDYGKVEDFFEDLRNVTVPDRIIDTQFKLQKKSRQTAKDIKDIKDVRTVNLDSNGLEVKIRGDWNTYRIDFRNSDRPEHFKNKMAGYYNMYDRMGEETHDEAKQAVFDELKKLACKLNGMSEEEMKRYVGTTHFREEENSKDMQSSEKLFLSLQSKDKQNNRKDYNGTVTELANRVKQGTARVVRESKEDSGSGRNGNTASIPEISGKIFDSSDSQITGENREMGAGASERTQEVQSPDAKRERFSRLEDWAKENGYYFSEDDIAKDSFDGKPWNTDGFESVVYRSKDRKSVIKVTPMDNLYDHPISYYLDRNKYFNEVFPDTAIEVIGYGRDKDGSPIIITKQPLIEGETVLDHFNGDEDKANEYINNYVKSIGFDKDFIRPFEKELELKTDGSNGKYYLFDINSGNIIIDKDGKPHVIDAEVLPVDYKNDGKIEIKDSDPSHFRAEDSVSVSDDAPVVVKHIDKVAKQVGGKVKMVSSVDEITDRAARRAIEEGRNITGWYDEKTGEVHLYMPNIHDRYTAEKTIWHEVVGHKGMRELIGDENYGKFLRGLWYDLDRPENARLKELVNEELRYNPLDFENGIEEGIARLVEDGKGEPGFWNAIKNKVTDLLHEVGYRIAPNTKDVKYLLWLAKNVQKNPNDMTWKMRAEAVRYKLEKEKFTTIKDGEISVNDGKVKDYSDFTRKDWEKATDMTVHFRTSPSAATEIDIYNRAVGNVKAMAEEAYSDKMNSLLGLYKAIDPSIKKVEDVKTSENPYMLENLMSSRAQKVGEAFVRDVMDPLTDTYNNIIGSFDGEDLDAQMRNANLYMVKKSGLERNRAFFVRDAIRELANNPDMSNDARQLQADWDAEHQRLKSELDSKRITLKAYFDGLDDFIRKNVDAYYDPNKNDYSGFHEMQKKSSAEEINDALIQDDVTSAESKIGDEQKVSNLWSAIKKATDYSLDTEYTGGFMDKELNQHVKKEMNWYVPMRMFDKETAEDIYGYIEDNGVSTDFVAPALMRAKGRESLGDLNILAQIGAMGEHAINRAARNAIKQAFARFVNVNEKAPVGERLVTEIKPWLEKVVVGGVETWEERYPQIADDATQLEISQAVEKFENSMKAKELKGEAKQMRRNGNIPYRFADKEHRPQHIVDVWVNGRKKSYIINGNPRAAQAINGMLDHKSANNFWSRSNRWLSQVCTSYNPEFTVRNAVRDYGFASHTLLGKEGIRYFMKFEKHYAALGFSPIANAAKGIGKGDIKDVKNALFVSLFKEYKNGTLDVNKSKYHKWFKEFMDNGGETGYLQMKNVDAWKKQIKTSIKDKRKGKLSKINPVKTVSGFVEDMNQMAENIARFATFCASREVGRNATRSAYDAKEVSVNFNRSGSAENVKSYKYEGMGRVAEKSRNTFGFTSCYLRNYTMFFNASVQSFKGLSRNIKRAPAGTIATMVAAPMSLGLLMPLINQMLVAALDDSEKDRKGVKDPYAELPEYVRRNNVCIYAGKGRFVQIPIAIEGRAFYGLGDIAASYTYKKDLRESRSLPLDIANQLSQIVPVGSFMESSSTSGDSKAFLSSLASTFLPSAVSPAIELVANRDWKGQPIYNDATYMENAPAWKKAYSGTSEMFAWANKKLNAITNDVDPGNEEMKGSNFWDTVSNPFAWEQVFNAYVGGMGTFATRSAVSIKHALNKDEDVEVKDIPFLRSFFFTPSSKTSLQRTKSKWYNYKDEVVNTNYNLNQLKHDAKDPLKAIRSTAAAYKYLNSPKAAEVNIVNDYDNRIGRLNKILNVVSDNDTRKSIETEKERLMMEAVGKLDRLE